MTSMTALLLQNIKLVMLFVLVGAIIVMAHLGANRKVDTRP